MTKLKLMSIFRTLDGEVCEGGPLQWSTFIRFGGCNLRCWKSSGFCDAPASLDMKFPFPEWTVDEVVTKVLELGCKKVTITGGEPLMQKEGLVDLLVALKKKVKISLETSGSIDLGARIMKLVDCVILDLKPPSTEMAHKNKYENLMYLRKQDWVKFVISDAKDFSWAKKIVEDYATCNASWAIGPRWGILDPKEIIKWMEEDNFFKASLNLQLHKYLWPESHPDPVADLKLVDFEKSVRGEK